MLVIAVVGIHGWVGCLPVKEMKSCWAFLPTPHGSVQMILWRNPQFPSQTKYGGLVRETEQDILVYLGCMVS